jgi:hypothetical protein
MAKGRMIARSLWSSEKFARLVAAEDGGWGAGCLFVAMVTGADVDGRLEIDSDSLLDLLARTGRHVNLYPDTVGRWRDAIVNVELVRRWFAEGKDCGEVVRFAEFNRLRKDREAPSRIPNPPDCDRPVTPPADSGRTPGVLRPKARQGKASESEVKARQGAPEPSPTEDRPTHGGGGVGVGQKPLRRIVDELFPKGTPAYEAVHKIAPVEPGGERVAGELAKDLSRLYNLPPQDGRVVADSQEWAKDRWRLNAAVQVLERLEDPDERRRLTNPVGYMRRAVEDRAKELKERHHNEIENVLDRGERQRHAEAVSRPVPYDPTA